MPNFLSSEEINKIKNQKAQDALDKGNLKEALDILESFDSKTPHIQKQITAIKSILNKKNQPQKSKKKQFITNKSFKDLKGSTQIIERFKNTVILSSQRPDLFKKYDIPKFFSFILYGAPGTGKTFLVEALAGETQSNLISVNLNDVLSKYVGESEKAIHELFLKARKTSPSILFFDEFDIIGAKRESSAEEVKTVMANLTAQLLTEMSGINTDRENVLVIAATNRIWDIDSALLRSKRFENKIYIKLPNKNERIELFKYYLSKKPKANINFGRIARATAFYSPADIERICKNAAEKALRSDLSDNKTQLITTNYILNIINSKDGRPSTEKWFFETKKEMIGYFKKDINGKKVWVQGKLLKEEKSMYSDYIKEVKRFYTNKVLQKLFKYLALYLI